MKWTQLRKLPRREDSQCDKSNPQLQEAEIPQRHWLQAVCCLWVDFLVICLFWGHPYPYKYPFTYPPQSRPGKPLGSSLLRYVESSLWSDIDIEAEQSTHLFTVSGKKPHKTWCWDCAPGVNSVSSVGIEVHPDPWLWADILLNPLHFSSLRTYLVLLYPFYELTVLILPVSEQFSFSPPLTGWLLSEPDGPSWGKVRFLLHTYKACLSLRMLSTSRLSHCAELWS